MVGAKYPHDCVLTGVFTDALYRAVLRKLETLRLKHISTIEFAEKVDWSMHCARLC
jgi:hypothetical protein